MRVAERRPFLASSAVENGSVENGSEIANRNSLLENEKEKKKKTPPISQIAMGQGTALYTNSMTHAHPLPKTQIRCLVI